MSGITNNSQILYVDDDVNGDGDVNGKDKRGCTVAEFAQVLKPLIDTRLGQHVTTDPDPDDGKKTCTFPYVDADGNPTGGSVSFDFPDSTELPDLDTNTFSTLSGTIITFPDGQTVDVAPSPEYFVCDPITGERRKATDADDLALYERKVCAYQNTVLRTREQYRLMSSGPDQYVFTAASDSGATFDMIVSNAGSAIFRGIANGAPVFSRVDGLNVRYITTGTTPTREADGCPALITEVRHDLNDLDDGNSVTVLGSTGTVSGGGDIVESPPGTWTAGAGTSANGAVFDTSSPPTTGEFEIDFAVPLANTADDVAFITRVRYRKPATAYVDCDGEIIRAEVDGANVTTSSITLA